MIREDDVDHLLAALVLDVLLALLMLLETRLCPDNKELFVTDKEKE
jgi:hypothetical protein